MKPFLLRLAVLAAAFAGWVACGRAQYLPHDPSSPAFSTWVDPNYLQSYLKPPILPPPPLAQEALDLVSVKAGAGGPEAGWGFPNYGWQLSLRMRKQEFKAGEAVTAWALMGNLAETNQHYRVSLPDEYWDVVVTTADNRAIQNRRERWQKYLRSNGLPSDLPYPDFGVHARFSHTVEAGRIGLHLIGLSAEYGRMQPGLYSVILSRRIEGEPGVSFSQVTSGTASFRILEPPEKPSAANQEMAASSGATPPAQPSIRDAPPIIATLPAAFAAEQTASVTMALPGTEIAAKRNTASTHTPEKELRSDLSSSKDGAGGGHPGAYSGTVRIGASVFVLLVAASLGFIVIRRARRHS